MADYLLSMVVGTSSSYQCFSSKTEAIPGIWGPWDNGDMQGLNAYTCGQNAVGALLDHLPFSHPAAAAGVYPDIRSAMVSTSQVGETLKPDAGLQAFYDRKYRVYCEMHKDQRKYDRIMNDLR